MLLKHKKDALTTSNYATSHEIMKYLRRRETVLRVFAQSTTAAGNTQFTT